MHFYNFHIGDYASHSQHLDPLEDIAYRRMLDWVYLNESPLPKDIKEIARLIRMREHCECIANVLREFWDLEDGMYIQARVKRELDRYRDKSEKAKKSAKARWNKEASKQAGLDDANALRTECERTANQEPLTKNQEPIPKNQNDQDITSSAKPNDHCPASKIIDLYHEVLPELAGCRVLTNKRRAAIRSRHNGIMEKDLDAWRDYFRAVRGSNFLMGRLEGKQWRANLDFLITEKACVGVLEGKYQ